MSNTQEQPTFKVSLGKHINSLRLSANLTQEELAEKSGLTRVTLADIEKGNANLSLDVLSRISCALGYKVTDLFSFGVEHQSAYIIQPTGGNLYEPLVKQLLSVPNGTLYIQVAYAKSSGVDLLTAALKKFKENGGHIRVMAGIDQKNTTAEALYKLMLLCDDLYVIHDRALAQTYHPKIYIVSSTSQAWVAVGSNNLTRGGLCTNYEACHTQRLNLTDAFDTKAYKSLIDVFSSYQASGLVMHIIEPDDIRELLRNRLIVTEQQSRQNTGHIGNFTSQTSFGHCDIDKIPTITEKVHIPSDLFSSPSSDKNVSPGNHSETDTKPAKSLNDSEITAESLSSLEVSSDIEETYWFEMRASTGGSRNILDLSSSAKLQSGTHPNVQKGQIPGTVTFFGINPLSHNTEKNITVVYNGIAYYPSTIKYAPNNASWRIQLKGDAETGKDSLSQFGRTDFAHHILIFHRITSDHYVLETMDESELEALKVKSEFWATNGNSKASKAFGKVKRS